MPRPPNYNHERAERDRAKAAKKAEKLASKAAAKERAKDNPETEAETTARIGRYYATESMLVLDPQTGRYDADATPSTGTDTLFDFYRAVLAGAALPDRGDHAVF